MRPDLRMPLGRTFTLARCCSPYSLRMEMSERFLSARSFSGPPLLQKTNTEGLARTTVERKNAKKKLLMKVIVKLMCQLLPELAEFRNL